MGNCSSHIFFTHFCYSVCFGISKDFFGVAKETYLFLSNSFSWGEEEGANKLFFFSRHTNEKNGEEMSFLVWEKRGRIKRKERKHLPFKKKDGEEG